MWEIIGDCLLITFGVILIYIFIMIEVLGYYGVEQNDIIRWVELFMGIPILWLGINRFIQDIKK